MKRKKINHNRKLSITIKTPFKALSMHGPYNQVTKKQISFFIFLSIVFIGFNSPIYCQAQSEVSVFKQASSLVTQGDFFNTHNQIRLIGFLAIISLIPFAIMMTTSFVRITIVFQFLKHALGAVQVPSNQIIIGLSLLLTAYVMHPVINKIQEHALSPYLKHSFQNLPQVQSGAASAEEILLEKAWAPLRQFLLEHTREKDLELFLTIGNVKNSQNSDLNSDEPLLDLEKVPWYCIIPSFMISELRTAFMMGFLLFLPFLIIDMVVSSVLMSMGMVMLPPMMISTPFKILLFILVDGWHLIIQQIVYGFHPIG
jgi:flagellar biosynthesis protein FliP